MSTRLPRISTTLHEVSTTLQEVGNSSYLGLFSILGWKWSDVRVSIEHPFPKRNVLRLSEDMRCPQEERGLHLGEGSVRLGEGVRLCKGMYA